MPDDLLRRALDRLLLEHRSDDPLRDLMVRSFLHEEHVEHFPPPPPDAIGLLQITHPAKTFGAIHTINTSTLIAPIEREWIIPCDLDALVDGVLTASPTIELVPLPPHRSRHERRADAARRRRWEKRK